MVGSLDGGVLALREVHRFANDPIRQNDSLRWDIVRLWEEMRRGLDLASENRLQSVGVDCWGVDYALLDAAGELLEQPYHYRDRRTEGVMESVFERVPRERIYAATGIQFLSINTIYQLAAACRRTPEVVDAARSLATIPDVLNYWLSGKLVSEYTIATTTQMVDARTRTWAIELLKEIGLPSRLLQPIVEAGTVIGTLRPAASTTGCRVHRLSRRRATTPGRRWHRWTPSAPVGLSQLWHVVAARHRSARTGDQLESAGAQLHERRRRLRDDAAAEEHRGALAAAVLPPPVAVTRSGVFVRDADCRSGRRRGARFAR